MRSSFRFLAVAVLALGVGTASAASAAQRQRSATSEPHMQFDQHDRQVTTDWYQQHQTHPPAGLRPQDRLTPDQERRLQPGQPLPDDLRGKVHTVPSDLRRQLPTPPPRHRYVAVGGHVGLVDDATHVVRDIIHLHGQ